MKKLKILDVTIQTLKRDQIVGMIVNCAALKIKKNDPTKSTYSTLTELQKSASDLSKCIYKKKLMEKKNEFRTTLFQKYKGDIKKTWTMVNHLLGKSRGQICQSLKLNNVLESDPKILANEFNSYFESIAERMKSNMPLVRRHYRSYLPRHSTRRSVYFWPTGPLEVKEIILSSKSKNSTGWDGISSKMLKSMPDIIFYHLSEIFNLSLHSGKFIDAFKVVKVVPIFKGGSRTDIGQYRPISLVSNIGKVLEKIVNKRLVKFLDKITFFFKINSVFEKDDRLIKLQPY